MTTLLQHAFAEAAKLPQAEQDVLAARLLAELAAEDDFDRADPERLLNSRTTRRCSHADYDKLLEQL
jgi:hypothetical protein